MLAREKILNNETGAIECDKNVTGPIFRMYCGGALDPGNDPVCEFFNKSEITIKPGIPGLGSGLFFREYKLPKL